MRSDPTILFIRYVKKWRSDSVLNLDSWRRKIRRIQGRWCSCVSARVSVISRRCSRLLAVEGFCYTNFNLAKLILQTDE
jgi:hypothetical protein